MKGTFECSDEALRVLHQLSYTDYVQQDSKSKFMQRVAGEADSLQLHVVS